MRFRHVLYATVAVLLAGPAATAHAQNTYQTCRYADVNRAYMELFGHPPTSVQCDPNLFGKTNSYAELKASIAKNVQQINHPSAPAATGVRIDVARGVLIDGSTTVPLSEVALISQDGAGLTASQASSLVAAGAGNLVAAGAGNFHVQSVGAKKVYVLKK